MAALRLLSFGSGNSRSSTTPVSSAVARHGMVRRRRDTTANPSAQNAQSTAAGNGRGLGAEVQIATFLSCSGRSESNRVADFDWCPVRWFLRDDPCFWMVAIARECCGVQCPSCGGALRFVDAFPYEIRHKGAFADGERENDRRARSGCRR